jgi:nitrite reductase/ring-hydroxylating ferredoxin subunit
MDAPAPANPARPSSGALLLRVADLGDPEARAVDFRSGDVLFSLVVVRRGDLVVAYENDCPHARQPMERPDGRVVMIDAQFLVCSAHGASFHLEDGACVGGPARSGLKPFPVEVRGGVIYAGR